MPAFAFTRQPDALAWFGTGRGGPVLASEQARVSQALTSRTPGPWLWVSPDGVEPAPAGDIPPMRGLRLHARSGAQRLTGQVRCGLPLPLPTEAIAVIVLQHVLDAGDPQPLPYLDSPANRERGQIDISLQVLLQTAAMQQQGLAPAALSRSNFRDSYWSVAQMLAHHSSGGCNLQTGDLLGTGTQSGPQPGQGGSLLELSMGGKQPVSLPGGETRSFLQDGDTVILRAHCEKPGARRIGFGDCRGTVLPAR